MYDAWWPDIKTWGLRNLDEVKRQRVRYYVTSVSAIVTKASFLDPDPLTPEEYAVHRPDLPFKALRDPVATWESVTMAKATEMGAPLRAAQVYLFPFGPDGGTKAGVKVSADDGQAFAVDELFRKARDVQARHLRDPLPTTGIGIYRTGLQRNLPAYYLWGAVSKYHAAQAEK